MNYLRSWKILQKKNDAAQKALVFPALKQATVFVFEIVPKYFIKNWFRCVEL